jgi:single-stranded DNA-binding protein
MNDVNPNNYDGANVTVVGRAGGPVEVKHFTGGGSVAELSIAVSQGYKKDDQWVDTGTTWYTLQAATAYAEDNWPSVGKGDKVRVDDAKQETREYKKRDESSGLQITLKFGTLTVVEAKNQDEASDGFVPAGATAGGFL